MTEKIMVIMAHPDDEVLGCGGTIALQAVHSEVNIAILGEGITSRAQSKDKKRDIARLRKDARAAATILGATSISFCDFPDNRFDELPLLKIIKQVENLIDKHRPGIIFTHHPGDLNIDHGITFRAVLTAARPLAGSPVKEIYACEIPSSTEWAFGGVEPAYRPNVFVDITATLEKKLRALECYQGEIRSFPHPRSGEAVTSLARHWGSAVGLQCAEAFQLIRSVR